MIRMMLERAAGRANAARNSTTRICRGLRRRLLAVALIERAIVRSLLGGSLEVSTDGVSETLHRFTEQSALARGPLLPYLRRAAASVPRDSTVLDVGAGEAPYRELFAHTNYLTCDRPDSAYSPAIPANIRAPAEAIPLEDDAVDVIICTQVLEHVADPCAVLAEFRRLLRPGGHLFLTAPLTWYLHEEPHDYYRYTPHGLRFLAERAGFGGIDIAPLGNAFSTLAQLLEEIGGITGADDSRDDQVVATHVGRMLAPLVASFSPLDQRHLLPTNYALSARAPAD
jgi:SAM-dependent methyltransferase